MAKARLDDRSTRRDRFHQKAKREGFLARAVYKLEEIDDKHHLFRAGDRVLDLGCAPGSWLQFARTKVGERGVLVGLDRTALRNPPMGARIEVGDVMSIDIDGDDYHVLAALESFLPRILLVEFNPTCPPGMELVQQKGGRFGCSAWSLLKLAQQKGYALAACTDTNLILVRAVEFAALKIEPVALELVIPTSHLAYVMTDYDGRAYLNRLPVYAGPLPAMGLRTLASRTKECG